MSEEQIKARFDEQAQSLESGVSLQAAHILLSEPDAALLAEVQSKLDAGEDFAALAKEYSRMLVLQTLVVTLALPLAIPSLKALKRHWLLLK